MMREYQVRICERLGVLGKSRRFGGRLAIAEPPQLTDIRLA